jgi:hypothetical protein
MGGIRSVGGKGTKLWLARGSVMGEVEGHACSRGRKVGYEAWVTSYGTRVRVRGISSSVRGMGAGLGTSHSKERRGRRRLGRV